MDGELGGPLGFVTVQVKAKGSDKIIQGSITGDNGGYVINGLKKGNYVVTFSYVGYKEVSKNISITRNNQVLNLGELTLVEDANRLGEVEVVAKKPQMRFEIDRKVFDATQDISSEGGSASDLLSNIPSVEVDNEGEVSLRGNSSVTIWINGKASGLTSDNQADILEIGAVKLAHGQIVDRFQNGGYHQYRLERRPEARLLRQREGGSRYGRRLPGEWQHQLQQ